MKHQLADLPSLMQSTVLQIFMDVLNITSFLITLYSLWFMMHTKTKSNNSFNWAAFSWAFFLKFAASRDTNFWASQQLPPRIMHLHYHIAAHTGVLAAWWLGTTVLWYYWIELNWIYWQTANEGRPRPEEIIGNAKINTKEKWRTYTEIKQLEQKTY